MNEVEVKIFDQEEVHYGCTVMIWKNSKTGDQSIGWKQENPGPKCFCCGMPLRWSCDYRYEDFGIDHIACWECDNCGAQYEAWFPEKDGDDDVEELVKSLRVCGRALEAAAFPDFDVCLYTRAADAIEDLQAQLMFSNDVAKAIAEKVPKWIPVSERLPEDGAEVLAWSQSGFAYVDWWIDGAWKVNSLVDGKYEFVTHWMPLPEPPKEGDQDGTDN